MFGLISKNYDPVNIYNLLSNNNQNKINEQHLNNFLLNINEQLFIKDIIGSKEEYVYEDFLKIDLDKINILHSIGHNLNKKYYSNYTVNPFKIKKYDLLIKSLSSKSFSTNNGSLLFENSIVNNSLYLTLFDEIIDYHNSVFTDKQDIEHTIKIYFPLLSNNEITNLKEFIAAKKDLLKKTNKILNSKSYINKNEIINLLKNVNMNLKPDVKKNINCGINYIQFNIYSNINLNVVLENIFKSINSNPTIPFIKYNPGKKIENIYRLYSNKISSENKKIPMLPIDKIIKYSKLVGKTNTIGFVLFIDSVKDLNSENEIFMELDNHGVIEIKIFLNNNLNIKKIESLIINKINPIVYDLINNISYSNNKINIFNSFNDDFVEIVNINYNILFNPLFNDVFTNFNKYKSCIYFLFNLIENNDTNKSLRYKRVSSYNEMDDKTIFIIELMKQKITAHDIIYY